MATLGGNKNKKRTKNKTETVTVNPDGSRTVTVTKNKTTTKTKGPTKKITPRKRIAPVTTLKPYGIQKQKIDIPEVKILSTPLKERPQKIKTAQGNIMMRQLMKRAAIRESQPLAPSPKIRNSVPNGRGQ